MASALATEPSSTLKQFKRDEPNQFLDLCKVHLKFLMDSTPASGVIDELFKDCEKWNKKSRKGSTNKSGAQTSGCSLSKSDRVHELIEFISKEENIVQEGLFRKTGNLSRQTRLKEILFSSCPTPLGLTDGYNVHDVASVLKWFFGELPEPLLTDRLYRALCHVPDMVSLDTALNEATKRVLIQKQIKAVQLLVVLLPTENQILLRELLRLLHQVALTEANKMTAQSLGTMFAPHILCPRKITATGLHEIAGNIQQTVSFLIEHSPEVGQTSQNLLEDIERLLKPPVRSKSMDGLDGAKNKKLFKKHPVAPCTPTRTTFVDRELSLQAHSQLDTQVALAELYAQAHAMPESSKKKKLLKQFNLANGMGTPADTMVAHRNRSRRRSRSVGESIKKRFFKGHKRRGSDHDSQIATPGGQIDQNSDREPPADNSTAKSKRVWLRRPDELSTPPIPAVKLFKSVINQYNSNMKSESCNTSPVRVVNLKRSSPVTPIDPSQRKRRSNSPTANRSTRSLSVSGSSAGIATHSQVTTDIRSPSRKMSLRGDTEFGRSLNHPAFVSPMTHTMKRVSKQVQVPGNRCKVGRRRAQCYVPQEAIMTPRSRRPMAVVQSPGTPV